jgi:adenylate kinase
MKIVLLGAPGVGKGTVAGLLAKRYHFPHISTGDIFKAAIRNQTEMGQKVKPIVESGRLVPDELVNDVVKERLSQSDIKTGYFLDGYPRTVEQAKAMESFSKPELVLNFTAPREEIIRRLSGRRVCTHCGSIFNIVTTPPKVENICDKCKEKLIKRADDDESVIGKRLDVYQELTAPLVDYYSKLGRLKDIDASFNIGEMDKILKQCDIALKDLK